MVDANGVVGASEIWAEPNAEPGTWEVVATIQGSSGSSASFQIANAYDCADPGLQPVTGTEQQAAVGQRFTFPIVALVTCDGQPAPALAPGLLETGSPGDLVPLSATVSLPPASDGGAGGAWVVPAGNSPEGYLAGDDPACSLPSSGGTEGVPGAAGEVGVDQVACTPGPLGGHLSAALTSLGWMLPHATYVAAPRPIALGGPGQWSATMTLSDPAEVTFTFVNGSAPAASGNAGSGSGTSGSSTSSGSAPTSSSSPAGGAALSSPVLSSPDPAQVAPPGASTTLTVVVRSPSGAPEAGVPVEFHIEPGPNGAGGELLPIGAPSGSTPSGTVVAVTNDQGEATVDETSGDVPGPWQVKVTLVGVRVAQPLTLHLGTTTTTAYCYSPRLVLDSPEEQVAKVGESVPAPLSATLTCEGSPAPAGVEIGFFASASPASGGWPTSGGLLGSWETVTDGSGEVSAPAPENGAEDGWWTVQAEPNDAPDTDAIFFLGSEDGPSCDGFPVLGAPGGDVLREPTGRGFGTLSVSVDCQSSLALSLAPLPMSSIPGQTLDVTWSGSDPFTATLLAAAETPVVAGTTALSLGAASQGGSGTLVASLGSASVTFELSAEGPTPTEPLQTELVAKEMPPSNGQSPSGGPLGHPSTPGGASLGDTRSARNRQQVALGRPASPAGSDNLVNRGGRRSLPWLDVAAGALAVLAGALYLASHRRRPLSPPTD